MDWIAQTASIAIGVGIGMCVAMTVPDLIKDHFRELEMERERKRREDLSRGGPKSK